MPSPVSSNIIENAAAAVPYAERVRPFRVEIDLPYGGTNQIAYHSERAVLVNGEKVASKSQDPVRRSFPAVQAEVVTITDPVTGQQVTISVAGVAAVIANRYATWYAEDKAAAEAREAARLAAESAPAPAVPPQPAPPADPPAPE